MKKKWLAFSTAVVLATTTIPLAPVEAVGNGPHVNGKESIQTSMLTTYDEMSEYLYKEAGKQNHMELEVIGQTVKGRDLFLVKYISNPENPTILYLTQQHGNEALITEGALDYIRHLGTNSRKTQEMLENVNILIVPMLNADGAMGDVNFSLDNYMANGRNLTRFNADRLDLNRDHVKKAAPETKALHENVLQTYPIDYMIDFHHQGTQEDYYGKLTSGAVLTPQHPDVDSVVLEQSKKLATVLLEGVGSKGWSHILKFDAPTDNPSVASNAMALQYDIPVILFEMRGMADHSYEPFVLGQKSNGYLIRQAYEAIDSTAKAISDGSINHADPDLYDQLPEQHFSY
ncbi:M14 family zinc carboxypeptidase [Alkalihalophilus marmarensis]|uniref:M14 family zinc carboxypeptidase n=1 Tax=Alkalihalophilus marmarensis TaxID=521377 RepID=UPI002E21236B|nr:M14 family zinc carboxypeptidase [Alkalihalophilus marmarensis]MED1601891.1 M14 family zinc carboxypeptidase [Alkalihalophilus marmarensis]